MQLHIPQVLTADQLGHFRTSLDQADWQDGRITAGYQSAQAKQNRQLRENDPLAIELGRIVEAAVLAHPTFFSAALPRHLYPPLFNRYGIGEQFDYHVDNAVRYDRRRQPPLPVRTDLSCTLFLSEPDSYDGGGLVIRDRYGTHTVKLPAGDLLLYPATSLHKVEPVTRGARTACFFWLQSMVRQDSQRELLFELDVNIQTLTAQGDADPAVLLNLTGIYHNLLRQWVGE